MRPLGARQIDSGKDLDDSGVIFAAVPGRGGHHEHLVRGSRKRQGKARGFPGLQHDAEILDEDVDGRVGRVVAGENVGHAKEMGLPVVIGRGADPSLLGRLSLEHALALAAVTADDLENIAVTLAARSIAPDLRLVLRAGSSETAGETRSLERLGRVRDVHRIGAVYLAGLALGSEVAHVVVDGDTAHLRDADGELERCPYPVAG